MAATRAMGPAARAHSDPSESELRSKSLIGRIFFAEPEPHFVGKCSRKAQMSEQKKRVAVIGAGPAGLMAAQGLARGGAAVTVIERMPSVARKFLMAGRGGLNLTHSEPVETFLTRYGADVDARVVAAIRAFPPRTQIKWAEGLGQETFIGSSGRVFPKAMKASPLLRAWLAKLEAQGVQFRTRTTWRGFGDDGTVVLEAEGAAPVAERFDAIVLALGGASWPRLGADGAWVKTLAADGVAIAPLVPANAGVALRWSDILINKFAGQPLKRIALTAGGTTFRGEAMVTRGGLEGGIIYAANEAIRAAMQDGAAAISIDLRPDLTVEQLAAKLGDASPKESISNTLRKAGGLSTAAVGVLHEGIKPVPREPKTLAAAIKAVPLTVTGFSGLERAISTAGGLLFSELDWRWMMTARPGVFVAGEMMDWTAPTGGYLLTACLATGRAAAEGCLSWLKASDVSAGAEVPPQS
jgi:uncharacterized flavoprotein (TIGR03862 family)